MATVTVHKNFNFDKDIIDRVGVIIKDKNSNFTKVIANYFQAIIKEPSIIDEIEQRSKQRTGSFIGMLDSKIGDELFSDMKREYHESIS